MSKIFQGFYNEPQFLKTNPHVPQQEFGSQDISSLYTHNLVIRIYSHWNWNKDPLVRRTPLKRELEVLPCPF